MNLKPKSAPENGAKKKKRQTPTKRFIFTVLKILLIFFVALSCAAVGIVGGAIYGYIKTAPPITDDQLKLSNFTSFVYDSKGNEIAQLKGTENRVWVYYKDLPKYLGDAFVSIEDERFYTHPGIDFKRIAGMVISFLNPKSSKYGASTITQQVIQNITGDRQRSLQRKAQEWWRAIQLEKKLTKWQILELYMNLVPMGGDCYGVQSAAKAYFNKDAKDLTLAECASLAGITNLPDKYMPSTDKRKENNKNRQEIILEKMLELGYITQDEYDKAIKEELKFVQGNKSELSSGSKQSYFVEQMVSELTKDLVAQGMSEQIARKTIFNNGLKIYTTMDSDIQKSMDSVFTDDKYFPADAGKKVAHPQAAMVIIDPKTGQVKALYGGYGKKRADLILNRATQIARQAGSSFKPIADYAPAIDQKFITPGTVIDDVPVYMQGLNKPRYPENYDKTKYYGLTTIRSAITQSVNVVAAKVWRDILGPDLSLQYLKKVGINRDNEPYVSLALGGLTNGVSPLQMAAAYVPLVNKGMYYQPVTYTKVEDSSGKVLLEKKPATSIAYEETTAFLMTSMMQDVCKVGTASVNGYGLLQGGKMPTAGKTGTTSDNKDKWFVGFSPYYVGATWYGYDTPTKLAPNEYNQALILWHEVMERAHKNLQPIEFNQPSGLVQKPICIYSGKTPSDLCAKDPRGNAVRMEYFVKGTEPKDGDVCDVHVPGKVCKDSTDLWKRHLLFGTNCPPESLIEGVFIQRKEPYMPLKPDDPYPDDWIYELPAGEYCNVHGAPQQTPATVSPVTNP